MEDLNAKKQDFAYDKKFHADANIDEVINKTNNATDFKAPEHMMKHLEQIENELDDGNGNKKKINIKKPSDFSEDDKIRAGIIREEDNFKRKLSNEYN